MSTSVLEISPAEKRITDRAKNIYESTLSFLKSLTTEDKNTYIKNHNEYFTEILINPYKHYSKLRQRLRDGGPTTSFEKEFKPVVMVLACKIFGQDGILNDEKIKYLKLQDTLESDSNKNYIKIEDRKSAFELLCDPLVHELISVMIKDRYMFPYKATILLIEHMLQVIDVYYRYISSHTNEFPRYYHNIRYRYYLTYMLDDAFPENIVFPTIHSIGATDLIKIRCVPILFLGVVTEPTHADQYKNTPLDFWAHDVQHIRRQYQETERYYDTYIKHIKYYSERSPFDIVSRDAFYQHMQTFTQETIIPLITKPNPGDTYKRPKPNPEDIHLYPLIKMIVFEIVHEKAWPITKFSLCRNVMLGYDQFPIEVINMNNGTDQSINIKTSEFSDPTTLANMYRKLLYGFYDDDIKEYIVPKDIRNKESIIAAVHKLMKGIGCEQFQNIENNTDKLQNINEKLEKLILDDKNCDEFLQNFSPRDGLKPDSLDQAKTETLATEHKAYTTINPHPNANSSKYYESSPIHKS